MLFEGVIWWQAVIAILLAMTPVIIWINVLLKKKRRHSIRSLAQVFILGTFTVIPLIAIQYLWYLHPEWDVYRWIDQNIATSNVEIGFLATFVVVGIMEEIVKMGVVRVADASKMKIQTINDAVQFSILAALGFAFSENIYYFYSIMSSGNLAALFSTLVFRSSFTVCAHMIFSSIFGYFYGIGKFSNEIVEQEKWVGEKHGLAKFLSKIGIKEYFTVKYQRLFTGLSIAMLMHAAFNFFLQMNMIIEAMALIIVGFIYVQFLMHRKAGHLILSHDATEGTKRSMMANTDEDVVLELVGMWFNDGKYQDVIEICERLLMRDPDNKVVKLFKAKALDRSKVGKAMNSIKSLFSEKDENTDTNILETLRKRKEEMQRIEAIKSNAEKLLDQKGPQQPE
ncbi:hypothetical protein COW94_03970 [Candidatus Peregrinibacteria bacterium CG22_combo_CG10-13_8_21_14_all_44_10]|nr:MAG: hypothetical protein AUK45_03255 [Candidatus Peregrinibacteria bacterium CG2_30_44_17]PIP66031.1 MAG: hypothetical protein COW94_03970 [Candidatus Peregrinibacteria bacterium CG22_combo_CG10-13_8_21_14_all_44_10]PIS03523.1 MAG: hypothetical protein COT83_05650 [Candidatus Peregrinibacteria bacterium CG10_big_fil_rev_8_21_14_0_10_44_7]PJB89560.1 MAG: hypothetical protein CO082_00510 [Candidatus Peregrinibacteria bacterium CG_4_9_14_0_8_um_filter_44_15]